MKILNFFDNDNGKYMVGQDAGATASGGWIPLYFTECKQEPVFDKIRAEITNIPITNTDGHNNNWYREPQAIINDVLQIIDKCRERNEAE